MDTMSFYFGIEDFEWIRRSIPQRKDNNKEKSFTEIFNYKVNNEGEKH